MPTARAGDGNMDKGPTIAVGVGCGALILAVVGGVIYCLVKNWSSKNAAAADQGHADDAPLELAAEELEPADEEQGQPPVLMVELPGDDGGAPLEPADEEGQPPDLILEVHGEEGEGPVVAVEAPAGAGGGAAQVQSEYWIKVVGLGFTGLIAIFALGGLIYKLTVTGH